MACLGSLFIVHVQGAETDARIHIASGAGAFEVLRMQPDSDAPMTVFTYLPAQTKVETARILFVMHGKGKDAAGYRDAWRQQADLHGFLVVAPLFDEATWGKDYSAPQLIGDSAKPPDPSQWTFGVIERLFDAIKSSTGNRSETYLLYGHSEGAQFVHRLVWFLPNARIAKAAAANAGWYTMPDFDVKYPFGLGQSPVTAASAKKSLERKFAVLLGDKDTDPHHPQLNRSRAAMKQGPHRLARGEHFFEKASETCALLKCRFGWEVTRVPGAAHSNAQMVSQAGDWLAR